MKHGKGTLFFSDNNPEMTGYLVIEGEHFELVGWRPSPARIDFTARSIGQRQANKPDSDNARGAKREYDSA
jgi:hypothetical protein